MILAILVIVIVTGGKQSQLLVFWTWLRLEFDNYLHQIKPSDLCTSLEDISAPLTRINLSFAALQPCCQAGRFAFIKLHNINSKPSGATKILCTLKGSWLECSDLHEMFFLVQHLKKMIPPLIDLLYCPSLFSHFVNKDYIQFQS